MDTLKRIFYIVTHPRVYFWFRLKTERMMLLWLACTYRKIERPDIWDLDNLREVVQDALDIMHKEPGVFDEFRDVKKSLFWHRLVSRFHNIRISRDDVRDMIAGYRVCAKLIRKPESEVNISDVTAAMYYLTSMFGTIIKEDFAG